MGYASHVPLYDPDKPLMSRGAERVFKWSGYAALLVFAAALVIVGLSKL